MEMLVLAIAHKSIKLWECAKVDLFPYKVNIVPFYPENISDLSYIVSSVLGTISKSEGALLIFSEIPQVIKYLPPTISRNYLIPITHISAPAPIIFLKLSIQALYKGVPFPTVFVNISNGSGKDLIEFFTEWDFPVEANSYDFMFADRLYSGLPENKTIILPFEETTHRFIDFMGELLYSFVPPPVIKEKVQAEAEISKYLREKFLKKREQKK